MKNKFLAKLFLLIIVCVSLNSCTLDELISSPTAQTDTSPTAKDGEPIVPTPRK
jgi:hypothetical protein